MVPSIRDQYLNIMIVPTRDDVADGELVTSTERQVHAPGKRPLDKPGKRVRFAEQVQVDPSGAPPHLLTPDVKSSCFYSPEEFHRMYQDSVNVMSVHVYHRYKKLPWDDDQHSIRGVEDDLQKELRLRSIRRHVNAVLDLQDEQEREGRYYCEDATAVQEMAEFSSKMSLPSRSHAVALAKHIDAVSGYYRAKPVPLLDVVRGKVSEWFSERTRMTE